MTRRIYRILLILGIVLALTAIPVFVLSYNQPTNLEVDFLDVGQGDAVLIQSPYGQNILIDGGPDESVIEGLSVELPVWDRIIDLMILTHPHDDHVAGLNDVLNRYTVKRVVYTGVVHDSPDYLAWLEAIANKNIPVTIIDRPQKIFLGNDCWLEIIYPRKSLAGQEASNLNNSSIALELVYGETDFFLSGDLEAEIEKELLEKEVVPQAQVFKANHHGSDTSNTQEFLEAISPEIVVVQVGTDNDFGHPSLRVLKRIERLDAMVYRNDIDGAVEIFSNGQEIWLAE